MTTPDLMKQKLKNVYFVWGRGKTTIANQLNARYGVFLYPTDEARAHLILKANPIHQPNMCRNIVAEYGVKSYWELPREVIEAYEKNFVAEMTPMILSELITLSAKHDRIICEGDIDYGTVAPIASHAVYLCCRSKKFDWFNRPDHENIKAEMEARTDLSEQEKQRIMESAYQIVSNGEGRIPEWVNQYNVPCIIWDDQTGISDTTDRLANLFRL